VRSKPEILEIHAAQCVRMAAAAHDSRLKPLLLDLAYQWRELAATARLLEADAKARDEFFGRERELAAANVACPT